MKIKKNFLLPHRNTNLAFIDGALCGLVIAKLIYDFAQDRKEMKRWDEFGKDQEPSDLP